MNILLAETSFIEQYGLLIALGIVLIGMLVFTFFRNKKFTDSAKSLIDGLKIGDKIKTYTGVYGTVVSFGEETDAKTVVIETGDENHKSFITVDSNVIYANLSAQAVAEQTVASEKVEEQPAPEETTKTDAVTEETPVKKTRAKSKKSE